MGKEHMAEQKQLLFRDIKQPPDLSDFLSTDNQMPDQHALCRFIGYKAEVGKIIFPLLAEVMQERPRKEQAPVQNSRIALRGQKICYAEHR